MDPRYLSQLKILMEWPQSLGIIGGRPSASLYFIGYQDENVIYLDPHAPQEVRNMFAVTVWHSMCISLFDLF